MDELQDSQNSMDPHNFFAQGKFKENLRSWIQKNPWEEPGVGLDPQGGLGLILLQEILRELFGFQAEAPRENLESLGNCWEREKSQNSG